MFLDDTVDILEEMPANVVERILDVTDKETRSRINELLQYPQDSAGSIMTTEYVDLKKTMSVREAIAKIKRVGIDQETIYTCYVIENKKLLGIVTAKSLLLQRQKRLDRRFDGNTRHCRAPPMTIRKKSPSCSRSTG